MRCRHCHTNRPTRPRGLCWNCYCTPGIRDRYPPTSKFARRGIGWRGDLTIHQPTEPTGALPGTAEKVAILERRAQQHESLWHPLDAPFSLA